MAAYPDPRVYLQAQIAAIARDWGAVYDAGEVEALAIDSHNRLVRSRLANLTPHHVDGYTRERLAARAQVEGRMGKPVPEVLFVDVQNAGRSQMASGLMHRWAAGRVHVRSAGLEAGTAVPAPVLEALAMIGIPLAQEFPKPLVD